MSFIIDVILIGIIAFTIFKGARRGFIKSVMSFVSLIVAFFVAKIYTPALSGWYQSKFIGGAVSEKIYEFISGFAPSGKETFDLSSIFGEGAFTDMLKRYGADSETLASAYGSITDATSSKVRELSEAVAAPVAKTLSDVLAFASIFFVVLIILWIVTIVINMVFKLPLLRTANKVLGIVFGCACALLYAWIFAVVAAFAIKAFGAVEPDMFGPDVVANSVLLKFFSENNPLRAIFIK